MNIVWNTCKSSLVRINMLKKGRAPRGNRYRINQYDFIKISSIEQVRPKNRRASEVMANDGWSLKTGNTRPLRCKRLFRTVSSSLEVPCLYPA
jgi:hypothetical protein